MLMFVCLWQDCIKVNFWLIMLVRGTCHVTMAQNSYTEGRHSLIFTFQNYTVKCTSKSAMEYIEHLLLILGHFHKSLIYFHKDRIKAAPNRELGHRLELSCRGGGRRVLDFADCRSLSTVPPSVLLCGCEHATATLLVRMKGENEFSSFYTGRFLLTQISSTGLTFWLLIFSALTNLLVLVLQTWVTRSDGKIRHMYSLHQCSPRPLGKALHS